MIKQILTSFAFVAASVAGAATFDVSFVEPSVVKGKELKAGDYKLNVKENSVVIVKNSKQQMEIPVKVEDTHQKYGRTRVLYNENKGKFTIQEIELGGTTTKLTFDNGVQTGGGE
jgi:chemotaxis receptor (MCP) glutamine deamidase CheD